MESIERLTKREYMKLFHQSDWKLFKIGANYYLRIAALLKMNDIELTDEEQSAVYCKDNRLLFRNIQKRLSIGIGSELLIKAHFINSGYLINKPLSKNFKGTLHKIGSIPEIEININETFSFDKLIHALPKLEKERIKDQKHRVHPEITEGLKIAKVFRNKEAHVITNSHDYNELDYSKIEKCIIKLYKEWFNEEVNFNISFEKNEIGKFEIKK